MSSTDFYTTNLLDVNWTASVITVIIKLRHRVFLRQRTLVDVDHRGGRTQISGSKASEPQTSRPVDKRNFTYRYPTCISCPRLDDPIGIL